MAQNRGIGEREEPTWPSVGLGRQRAGSEALSKLGRDAPEVIDAHVHVLSDLRLVQQKAIEQRGLPISPWSASDIRVSCTLEP